MKTIRCNNRTLTPSKIVCVGRNYVAHITELNNEMADEMVVFSKPNLAITSTLRSFHQETLHYEAEICFLVEKGRYSAVGCGLDLTKRQLQSRLIEKGLPWERAKAFDGSAIFSDFVDLPAGEPELRIELQINTELRQQGSTEMMIYSPQKILAEIQTFMSLNDGDLVMTGTPAGVGEVVAGDVFTVQLFADKEQLVHGGWQAI